MTSFSLAENIATATVHRHGVVAEKLYITMANSDK